LKKVNVAPKDDGEEEIMTANESSRELLAAVLSLYEVPSF
jgi:hypothetical protein